MSGTCPNDTGLWKNNEVKMDYNNTEMDKFNTYQRKVIAEHEFGHAYGLAHVYSGCCLMKQGDHKFTCGTMPDADAIEGVEDLYP